jgi:branched-chain amino acid aminotransferase
MSLNVVTRLPALNELGFGRFYCPWMIDCHTKDGKWGQWEMSEVKELSLHPGAKVFHYAQEIFEGLKAYKLDNGQIALFRPDANIRRMTKSAEIMAMQSYPEKEYMDALKALTVKCKDFVPQQPGALYLRPTMIGTTSTLGVVPSTEYQFFILASPVGGYFGDIQTEKPASITVEVTETYVRAVRGGLGTAKTGANYAASLKAVSESKKKGFTNVLFLDAIERKYLEELSGMNVFVVIDGVLRTPSLGDTILPGVTRDSIIQIAKDLGIPVKEDRVSILDVIGGLQTGKTSELFACGTASAVTAISHIGWRGEKLAIPGGPVATQIYQALIAMHAGRGKDTRGWLVTV